MKEYIILLNITKIPRTQYVTALSGGFLYAMIVAVQGITSRHKPEKYKTSNNKTRPPPTGWDGPPPASGTPPVSAVCAHSPPLP